MTTIVARPFGRLKRRAEFLAAAAGRRFRTARMTIMAIPRPTPQTGDAAGIRVGFTITRKVGHATERNRIRRRLRAAAAAAAVEWPQAALDVVVVARREVMVAPFPALVADLTRAVPDLLRNGNKAPHPSGANG